MLSSSRGQGNFWGLEASRPRPRTWPSGPRPRTSKCVLEAKDNLEDSTLGNTIHDTSFCDAIANIYDEMMLKNFINTIAKPQALFTLASWSRHMTSSLSASRFWNVSMTRRDDELFACDAHQARYVGCYQKRQTLFREGARLKWWFKACSFLTFLVLNRLMLNTKDAKV